MVFSCAWVTAGAPCLVLGPGIFCVPGIWDVTGAALPPQPSSCGQSSPGRSQGVSERLSGQNLGSEGAQVQPGRFRSLQRGGSCSQEENRGAQVSAPEQQEEVCLSQMFSSHQARVISAGKPEG